MDKTIRLKLKLTPEEHNALLETTRQFTESFNTVCSIGWQERNGNAYTLHHLAYRDCKDALPDIVSDLHVQAIRKAAEAVKSAITRGKNGKKTSCPHSALCPPRYNLHTFKIYWDKSVISMSTTAGRLRLPFKIPEYARYAIELPTATADLVYRKNRFYLHIVVKATDVEFIDNGSVIGVDIGVTRPAVTSDNRFHGNRHMQEVVKRTVRLRRALQSNGSKSAKRHLRSLAGREQRFRRDCDHVVSKSIIDHIEPGTTVVIENLTDIRTRCKTRRGEAKRRLHSWSFAQLKSFLEYKAEAAGCQVASIDPRHTSQRCSRCGYVYRGNRKSQSEFCCRKCGFKHNADLNASKNIRDKHLVGWTTCPSDGPHSTGLSSQVST